jgi:cell division septal protein FtsQ
MSAPIRKIETQDEKVIDYQYIRNLKNKEVRKTRFKRTASQRTFRLLLILILLGEVGYLSYQLSLFFKGSQVFALNRVEVTGTHKTKPEEIQKIVMSGQSNALLADLTQIKLRLENHPWIQSAVIWRELPGTIRVHITERTPAALVLSGNLYLVDHAGRIIQVFDQDTHYSSLPVITGISDLSDAEQIKSALEFVDALSKDEKIVQKISEIHYYDNRSTIIYMKGLPFGLLVSKDGILPMVRKFLTYADFMEKNFPNQKLIDLRYEDQIVLKNAYKEQL